MGDTVYYAIGDIHGEAARLRKLHQTIHDIHDRKFCALSKTIVHLGDYVDRGPDSYGVLETILALERRSDVNVISLKGNHEQLMLDACRKGGQSAVDIWLDNGGGETLLSYQKNNLEMPPDRHLNWVCGLATMHWNKSAKIIFVHAGIKPDKFPFDGDEVRLWTRARSFFDTAHWKSQDLDGMRVVHGHTPTENEKPDISKDHRRINVDTGACYGGPLTAAVIAPGRHISFLFV